MRMEIDFMLKNITDVPLDKVRLLDYRFVNAKKAIIKFINKVDRERVLAGFRKTAGMDTKDASCYGGWEDSLIAGHCLGHYFTACAQVIASGDDEDKVIESNLNYIIEELKKCQDVIGTGFLSAASIQDANNIELQFDIEEGKATGKTWVPWYAFHKVLQGMIDVYTLAGNETALHIACKMGDWTYNRVSRWHDAIRKKILSSEYGGMNESLYNLYNITKNENYFKAAENFDDPELYENIASGTIVLNRIHANTTIPKFLGAVGRADACRNVKGKLTKTEMAYINYATAFWNRVSEEQTYITGGISDMEHFREKDKLDWSRTQCNCEGCCAYNMMKLSKKLYCITGEKKYVDYYEKALRNAVLGSINYNEGTTTYFSPMGTGYYKHFGAAEPENNSFWCCTGTGMENYTKLNGGIYYVDGTNVYINQYVASELIIPELDIRIQLRCDVSMHSIGKLWIERGISKKLSGISAVTDLESDVNVFLRIPDWADKYKLKKFYNGNKRVCGTVSKNPDKSSPKIKKSVDGYYRISNIHKGSFMFRIEYKMSLNASVLEGDIPAVGFMYGPTVLCAKLGKERMNELIEAGIDVKAPAWKVVGNEAVYSEVSYGESRRVILDSEFLKLEKGIKPEDVVKNPKCILKKLDGDELAFQLIGADTSEHFNEEIIFVPYNEIIDERYGIYWYFIGDK